MPTSTLESATSAPAANGSAPLRDISLLHERWLQFRKSKSTRER
jgi:hypothetical protein